MMILGEYLSFPTMLKSTRVLSLEPFFPHHVLLSIDQLQSVVGASPIHFFTFFELVNIVLTLKHCDMISSEIELPLASMYGISTYIYHKIELYHTWIL